MPEIYLGGDGGGNNFDGGCALQTRAGAPAVGLTLTYLISATPTGSAIHASLSKPMVEGATVDGHREYVVTFPAADLRTHLADYLGKKVYGRRFGGGDDEYDEIDVFAGRPVGSP